MKTNKPTLLSLTLSGLFNLLPILIFVLIIREILDMIIVVATPLADIFFTQAFIEAFNADVFLALFLLFIVSLAVGLSARLSLLRKAGQHIEGITIGRLPMYKALKQLVGGFSGTSGESVFRTGLLRSSEDQYDLVYVVEDHGNGKLTVMLPWAPAAFAGSIRVVSEDQVEYIDSNIGEYSRVLGNWGVGTAEIIQQKEAPKTKEKEQ